jgi:hypothetical protein
MTHPEVSRVVSKEAHRAFAVGGKLAELSPESLGVQPVPESKPPMVQSVQSAQATHELNTTEYQSGGVLPARAAAPQVLASC